MAIERLQEFLEKSNIVDMLTEEELTEISSKVINDLDKDERSRQEWLDKVKKGLKLANLESNTKSFPWPNAANVKYPLITNAAIQFAARTYPMIIRGKDIVLAETIGFDKQGKKAAKAKRVSMHMSSQLLDKNSDWEQGLDQMLPLLAIIGIVFKKTWFDPVRGVNRSDLLLHDEVVVNHNIRSLKTARRISHLIPMHSNEIIQNMRAGIYTEYPIEILKNTVNVFEDSEEENDNTVIEQHRWLDLDKDDYEEPYIVTVHRESGKVLRIVPRFTSDQIQVNEQLKVVSIEPKHYFTDFIFIPSPDGKYHGIGYATLLLPFNETINTIHNQLLDAGTLANMQGGFLAKNFKVRGGSLQFSPGEWKYLDSATSQDISQAIIPFSYKEPSTVLLQLMTFLIDTAKELSSNTEALQGTAESQNTPATTILALVEQGLKVYTAIQRRLHRSLSEEFKKLFKLNQLFLDPQEYLNILDEDENLEEIFRQNEDGSITILDYEDDNMDIRPVSDPNMSSMAQTMARSQALLQLANQPEINRREVFRQYLEAINAQNIDLLLPEPQPQPPSMEQIELQSQLDMRSKQLQFQQQEVFIKSAEANSRIIKNKAEAIKILAQAEGEEPGRQLEQYKTELDSIVALNRLELDRAKQELERDEKSRNPQVEGPESNAGAVPIPEQLTE